MQAAWGGVREPQPEQKSKKGIKRVISEASGEKGTGLGIGLKTEK